MTVSEPPVPDASTERVAPDAFTIIYDVLERQQECVCHFVDIGVGWQKASEDPMCPRCTLAGLADAILGALHAAGFLADPAGLLAGVDDAHLLGAMRSVVEAAETWRGQFAKAQSGFPRRDALIAAVDAYRAGSPVPDASTERVASIIRTHNHEARQLEADRWHWRCGVGRDQWRGPYASWGQAQDAICLHIAERVMAAVFP